MSASIIIILVGCGVFANFMSALFGIGGGVLMVPLLMTIFPDFSMQMVAAISLSIVIGTALINLTYFIRQKIAVSIKGLLLWSLGMIIGVQAGFELSFLLSSFGIIVIFSATMLILAVKTFYKLRRSSGGRAEAETEVNRRDLLKGFAFCSMGGVIAGITGIGGGSIMAPLINQLSFVRHHQVAVYTNYMMVLGGLGSLYGYLTRDCPLMLANTLQIGYVNFSIIGIVLAGSFGASFISMRLRGLLKPRLSDLLLGCLLIFIAGYVVCVYLM